MLMTALMLLSLAEEQQESSALSFLKAAFLYHGYMIYYSKFIFEILQTTQNQPRIRIFLFIISQKQQKRQQKNKKTERIKNYKKTKSTK
jgi:hypothetical protein